MTAPGRVEADHLDLSQRAIRAVAEVLGVTPATVTGAGSLFDLPGFDSLAVVTVLEDLESGLGIEVPPECIVPEAFESIDTLSGLFARAAAAPFAR